MNIIKYWFYSKASVYMDVDVNEADMFSLYEGISKYLNECITLKELEIKKRSKSILELKIDGYFLDEEEDEDIVRTISNVVKIGIEEFSGDVKGVSITILDMLKSSITKKEE